MGGINGCGDCSAGGMGAVGGGVSGWKHEFGGSMGVGSGVGEGTDVGLRSDWDADSGSAKAVGV